MGYQSKITSKGQTTILAAILGPAPAGAVASGELAEATARAAAEDDERNARERDDARGKGQ